MKPLFWVVLTAVVAVCAGWVVFQHGEGVSLHFWFATPTDVPLWSVMLGSLLIGALASTLACAWPILNLRLRLRRQSRQLTRLEQEVHGLRTLPLSDEDSTPRAQARER